MLKIVIYAVTTLLVMIGSWVFVSKRKHLLGTLLSLEFIILSLYIIVFVYVLTLGYELYFIIIFLTMVVCEGALGLSILVSIIRTHGNDYFQRFNILQC